MVSAGALLAVLCDSSGNPRVVFTSCDAMHHHPQHLPLFLLPTPKIRRAMTMCTACNLVCMRVFERAEGGQEKIGKRAFGRYRRDDLVQTAEQR